MSPPSPAIRRHGLCMGSLTKAHVVVGGGALSYISSSAFSTSTTRANDRSKSHDFCVLVGSTLVSYLDRPAYLRTDPPTSEVRIVGASSWNPVGAGRKKGSSSVALSMLGSAAAGSPAKAALLGDSSLGTTFRIVTQCGTHLYCSAPSHHDRDTWLAALHAGLEASYASYKETLAIILPPHMNTTATNDEDVDDDGNPKDHPPLSIQSESDLHQILKPPVPQRSTRRNRTKEPTERRVSSHAYVPPYEVEGALSYKSCQSCGRFPPEPSLHAASAPLPQYGMECRVDVCSDCLVSQGILEHVTLLTGLYAAQAHERAALTQARDAVVQTISAVQPSALPPSSHHHIPIDTDSGESDGTNGDDKTTESNSNSNSSTSASGWTAVDATAPNPPPSTTAPSMIGSWTQVEDGEGPSSPMSSWVNLEPTEATTKALLDLVVTSKFMAFRRRSRALHINCRRLESGGIGCASEFLEVVDEDAKEAAAAANNAAHACFRGGDEEAMGLKKEAFRVAGDMGAAIKLLHDYALPPQQHSTDFTYVGTSSGNTEMLACILEFLLDLCDEGEISSVAFFWPQLRNIHMRMLPPADSDALVRVELMEDFLLTICARYSVHLALELVWGLVADLEDSLTATTSHTNNQNSSNSTTFDACVRRRFAVLRFVCELESLLFDFDGGWGGGSVSLGAMLAPSDHQATLLRDSMAILQLHRQFGSHHLTRSVRLDKLRSEAREQHDDDDDDSEGKIFVVGDGNERKEEEEKARKKVVKNADYFSAQIMFARRLGDIAERLRFMDVDKREAALEEQLALVNASGKIGGDPLNQLLGGFATVLNVPNKETHVFRSKERTPVLLLMELLREETDDSQKNVEHDDEIASPDESLPNEDTTNADHVEVQNNMSAPVEAGPDAATEEMVETIETEDLVDTPVEHDNVAPPEGDTVEPNSTVVLGDAETKDDNDDAETKDDADVTAGETVLDATPSVEPDDISSDKHEYDDDSQNVMNISSVDSDVDIAMFSTPKTSGKSFVTKEEDDDSDVSDTHAVNTIGTTTTDEGFEDATEEIQEEHVPTEDVMTTNRSKTPPPEEQLESITILESPPIPPKAPPLTPRSIGKLKQPVSTGAESQAPGTPGDKEAMENLVASMMHSKLQLPNQLNVPELEGESEEEDEEAIVVDMVSEQIGKEGETSEEAEIDAVLPSLPSLSKEKRSVSAPATSLITVKDSSIGRSTSGSGRKMTALGSLSTSRGESGSGSSASLTPFSASGEARREVLTAIMLKGMHGTNSIAQGAAPAAQRTVQAMDRQRAVELLMGSDSNDSDNSNTSVERGGIDELLGSDEIRRSKSGRSMSISSIDDGIKTTHPSEEDECMESLRLLLIQNRVALGDLTPENAALALAPTEMPVSPERYKGKGITEEIPDLLEHQPVDAGDVDPRLAGCGPLSHAILCALRMWQNDIVSNAELLDLVQKDLTFVRHSVFPGAENTAKLVEDSKFWVRFAFGERWAEKKARIASTSQYGGLPGWDVVGVIVKSNDDLRQEEFVMQLIELSQEAFDMAGLELWTKPYRILATGRTTGIIECVRNAMSFDSLKKRPGYGKKGLRGHLLRMTEFSADPVEAFKTAQKNFVRSLAAYSLLSYLFLFKDRHNGNILLDTAGHVIHIDFGFVFGIAPGGSFSLEQSAPFKLTEEMIDVMDGLRSPLFSEFVTLFCCGFLALQAHTDTFLTVVEITCRGSGFNCFEGKNPDDMVAKLRDRFCAELDKEASVAFALDLIKTATTSYGTKQYDYFQYLSQGIAQ